MVRRGRALCEGEPDSRHRCLLHRPLPRRLLHPPAPLRMGRPPPLTLAAAAAAIGRALCGPAVSSTAGRLLVAYGAPPPRLRPRGQLLTLREQGSWLPSFWFGLVPPSPLSARLRFRQCHLARVRGCAARGDGVCEWTLRWRTPWRVHPLQRSHREARHVWGSCFESRRRQGGTAQTKETSTHTAPAPRPHRTHPAPIPHPSRTHTAPIPIPGTGWESSGSRVRISS